MLSDELFVVLFQSFVVPLQQISISNSCRRVSRSHLDSLRTLTLPLHLDVIDWKKD